MLKRSATWGSLITGFFAWILALNAALSNEYIGAGILLVASALAFGIVAAMYLANKSR
jgi:hypothetical protein